MKRLLIFVSLVLGTTTAHATLDDAPSPASIEAICELTHICGRSGRCAPFPAFGTLLLVETDEGFLMGQTEDTLSPIARYSTVEEGLTEPPQSGTGRREFLVDLPPEDADLRFAQFIMGFDPATRERTLRPRHFTLACELIS